MVIKELKNDIKINKLKFSDIFEIELKNFGGRRTEYITAKDIPNSTGIYIFFNSLMEVMYIGKSTELRNRFRAHFAGSDSKVYLAYCANRCNIKYYTYALCENNRDAEMYEMIYTRLYNPKLVDMSYSDIKYVI